MKVSTVCYIEEDNSYYMLFRNKKKNDANEGKYIGIGGQCEEGESPEECAVREVYEETGVKLLDLDLRGVVTFISDVYPTEIMFVYTSECFEGEIGDCDEGTIYKVKKDEILNLKLWEGDKHFLRLMLENRGFFEMTLRYNGDDLESYSYTIHDEESVREDYKEIVEMLKEKKLSIATMESITGGKIASLITDNEGSSQIFKGGLVTYSNEMKIRHGVDASIIEKCSVYSRETAEAMARAAAEYMGTDIGIGVTGTAGNIDPANSLASTPGLVYIGISTKDKVYSFEKKYDNIGKRCELKLEIAFDIADALLSILCSEL